jgi:hypothetical protein
MKKVIVDNFINWITLNTNDPIYTYENEEDRKENYHNCLLTNLSILFCLIINFKV